MSDHRRIDRARAERLLDGTEPGTGPATDPVGRLLAAARAPAQPGELYREAEALGAFRVARGAIPEPRRLVRPRRMWRRLVGVKAAALGLALAAAGVAVAAGTGVLPTPLTDVPTPTSAGPPATPGSRSSEAGHPSSSSPASASANPTNSADHASLVGLCRAFRARGNRDPGAAMGSAAYAALVAAAGGPDLVEAFCTALVPAEDNQGNDNGNGNGGNATTTASPAPTNGQNTNQNGQSTELAPAASASAKATR